MLGCNYTPQQTPAAPARSVARNAVRDGGKFAQPKGSARGRQGLDSFISTPAPPSAISIRFVCWGRGSLLARSVGGFSFFAALLPSFPVRFSVTSNALAAREKFPSFLVCVCVCMCKSWQLHRVRSWVKQPGKKREREREREGWMGFFFLESDYFHLPRPPRRWLPFQRLTGPMENRPQIGTHSLSP